MHYDLFCQNLKTVRIDLKDELARDSVTFEAVDFQDVFSCFVAGDTV